MSVKAPTKSMYSIEYENFDGFQQFTPWVDDTTQALEQVDGTIKTVFVRDETGMYFINPGGDREPIVSANTTKDL